MTPITRDEIEELERKAKAATQEQWFIIDSTRTPGEFRVGGDGPVVFDNPSSKLEWSLIVGEGDGYSVVFGGTPRADEECHEEIFAALDHIAAACPRTTLRLIARIRELEAALKPFADYAKPIDENRHEDHLKIGYYTDESPTAGDCRIAAAVLAKSSTSKENAHAV